MRTVDEILEEVRHLSAREQQELRKKLEQLRETPVGVQEGEPAEERLAVIDSFLKLAGTGHSDFTDVSSNKGKHLAEAYAAKPPNHQSR